MKINAVWSRMMQFRSGPNQTEFAACEEHRLMLDGHSLFFARECDPVEAVHPDDERDCDFCREG